MRPPDVRLSLLSPAIAAATVLLGATAPQAAAQNGSGLSTVDTAYFAGLSWVNIGPNRGGRSVASAGSAARPNEYYFGAAGGGLWKTSDGGQSWDPVTDGQISSASVGSVAVCEANPDVVYIGTGETQLRGNVLPGDGLYKSSDAGKTWNHIGLKEARNFSRVRVHPTDCNTVFAGAFGEFGTENDERGLYKSSDGGKSWRQVLTRDDKTAAVDISIDQKNPNVVYAALWEAFRKPWGMSSGGPGSGLFKSTDGGENWTEISRNPGLPTGMLGKIGVAVSPVDGNRVYAIIEADEGGVFQSDDAGATWKLVNEERKLRQRAFYYTRIYADPQVKDRVYVLNTGFYRSDDGGKTFDWTSEVPHGDNHDLWIAPNDNKRMINSNDGGGNVSVNGGETWTEQDYPTAQPYYVVTTAHEPYHVCGAQQDNSTICVQYRGWDHLTARGPNHGYFYAVGGGESGYIAPDPKNTDIFYAGNYGGLLTEYDHSTGQERAVNVWPENPMGESSIDMKERFQWSFPIVFSKTDPSVLYATSQHVFRSTNGGDSWDRISPDLTRHDPSTLGPSGGPITKDQTGVETYATVFALAPSALDGKLIWAGSDDGLVHLTRDGGTSWQNVTPEGLPEFTKITILEASPHKPGTAYFAGHRFLLGDYQPYFYRTDDFGQSWTKITNGIPADEIARSIREDIVRPGLLFAGTERGVWVSFNDGANWQRLQRNLPTVQIPDITVEEHDLVIATHGRSFWVLPNIDVLRQITPAIETQRAHLFAPAPTVRGVMNGVVVDYYLKSAAQKVTLEILDPQGKVIRTFVSSAKPASPAASGGDDDDEPRRGRQSDPTAKAGMNRFAWDMSYPAYTRFPGMILWSARTAAPAAVPGRYQVRLTVDGQAQTQPFEIRMDPRLDGKVTVANLQKRFDLAMQVRDKVSEANEAVLLIRGVAAQLDAGEQSYASATAVSRAAEKLAADLGAVEQEIYQVRNRSNQDPLNYPIKLNNKLAALLGHVESADAAPTEQSYSVLQDLSGRLDVQLGRLNQILDGQLATLNQQLRAAGLKEIARTPLEVDAASLAAEAELLEDGEEEQKRW